MTTVRLKNGVGYAQNEISRDSFRWLSAGCRRPISTATALFRATTAASVSSCRPASRDVSVPPDLGAAIATHG